MIEEFKGIASTVILSALLSVVLTGCSSWFKKPDPRAACYSECPDLVELRDSTFGATTEKLKEIADQYYNCRKACRGPEQK